MNFLDLVPQQNKYNPAYYTQYRNYVGFPVLSGFQFQGYNDAFSVSRAIVERGGFKDIEPNNIIASLTTENNLGAEIGLDIFSMGFKVGDKNQFHINLGVEAQANLMLTKETFSFIFRGPGAFIGRDGENALSGNAIEANVFAALSFGYSREITEKLSIGGRVKFISGIANLHTERSDIRLHIDEGLIDTIVPFTYTVQPNVEIRSSFANIPKDSSLFYLMRNPIDINDMLPSPFANLGIGFDFGAVYEVNDYLKVAASVYDIGFINWTHNTRRIASEGHNKEFVFSGIDLDDMFDGNGGFDFERVITKLKDSVTDFLQLNQTDTNFKSYRSPLRTSYNLSGFYNLTDKDQIGVMWNSRIGKQTYNALTIAYTRSFGRNFQVCINNAIINETPFNFGGGFAFNAGSLQFYLIIDKINSIRVVDMRLGSMNVQFGLNFVMNRFEKNAVRRQLARDFSPRDRTGYVNDRWFW
jgi:hypothetical protein